MENQVDATTEPAGPNCDPDTRRQSSGQPLGHSEVQHPEELEHPSKGEYQESLGIFSDEHGHPEGHHQVDHGRHRHQRHERGEVEVTINTLEKHIHRGSHTVSQLKNLGGVPLADDLDQIVDGKLTALADDASVEICGGEMFLSHPKDGGSSHEETRVWRCHWNRSMN